MRTRLLILLLWIGHLSLFAQLGGDGFNPSNPADPQAPVPQYTLRTEASPTYAGSTNRASGILLNAGSSAYLSASANNGYRFVQWMMGDSTLTTSSSFYYTMPKKDVTLRAVFASHFDPSNPGDPDVSIAKHKLFLEASPAGAGSFNYNAENSINEGRDLYIYAYAQSGYVFKGWMQGDSLLSEKNELYFVMGSTDVRLVARYEYNPTNPGNPGSNYWDATTGEVLVDDFTPGSLTTAIYNVIGGSGNAWKVTQITVSGQMNSNDFGVANNFTSCRLLDLSRAYGFTTIPSYGFDYCSALCTIVLPACVENIGYRAFYQCSNLSEIISYAVTPPTVENYAFSGIASGAVVHVLSAAISLYAEAPVWKDFTILALTEEVRALEIDLPTGSEDGRYKNMTLELVNTATGQKQKYVVSDRIAYTFNGLLKNTNYNAYLKTAEGIVIGEIKDIAIVDDDVKVSFENIKTLQSITVRVLTADKQEDVTTQAQISWFDAAGAYLKQGAKMSDQLADTRFSYRVVLPQSLGMQYVLPTITAVTVADTNSIAVCSLQPIDTVAIKGIVKDADGLSMKNVTVSVSQTLNGKYAKAFVTQTDTKGAYALTVFNQPSEITVSANDYVSKTWSQPDFTASADLGTTTLRSVSGATITMAMTYTSSVVVGSTPETQNWYADYANVSYTLYNKTRQMAITQFSAQYPKLVLLEEVAENDQIEVTATSKVDAFVPVKGVAVIDSMNRATVTLPIVALGGLQASFASTDNASVVGILYNAKGELIKKYTYSNALISLSNLADGNYTLVSMANSSLFNSILKLSQIAAAGLKEGSDYVQNTVAVKSGIVSTIYNEMIPVLDESKLYYTGANTSFSVNKSSIIAGNYLTLKGKIDFKSAYAGSVQNVNMIIDLPEACSFVENSVMVGSSIANYTLDGSRLTIPLTRYSDQVRLCIIPTAGGSYQPNAFVEFTLADKTIMQPIGSAGYEVKDLTINVPSKVSKTAITISGTSVGSSEVKIFDDGTLIGQTTSLANGMWSVTCELGNCYNLSSHNIYASVKTKQGIELKSETKGCVYDKNAIEPRLVTMSFYNGWLRQTISVDFDFQTGKTSNTSYMFYTGTDLTFVIDLTNNDPEIVTDVTLLVYTDRGEVRKIPAQYNAKTDRWICSSRFESNNLPVNLNVNLITNSEAIIDRGSVDNLYKTLEQRQQEIAQMALSSDSLKKEIEEINLQRGQADSIYATLLEAIHQGADSYLIDSLIERYYLAIGLPIEMEDLTGQLPEKSSSDYIDSLLNVGNAMLSATDEELPILLSRSELFQTGADSLLNFMSDEIVLSSALEDSLAFVYENTSGIVYRRDYLSLDLSGVNESNSFTLTLSDESKLLVYHQGNRYFVVDSSKLLAWEIVTDTPLYKPSRLGQAAKASDVVAQLRQIASKVQEIVGYINVFVQEFKKPIEEQIKAINQSIETCEDLVRSWAAKSAAYAIRTKDLEKQIILIEHQINTVGDVLQYNNLVKQRESLIAKRLSLLEDINKIAENKYRLEAKRAALKNSRLMKLALFGQIADIVSLVQSLNNVIQYAYEGIQVYQKWNTFAASIMPCPNDYSAALSLVSRAQDDANCFGLRYVSALTIAGLSSTISVAMMAGKLNLVMNLLGTFASNYLSSVAENQVKAIRVDTSNEYSYCTVLKKRLKCHNGDDNDDNGDIPPFIPISPIHDPSGYVYEAVSTNRLQGVTATAYYKETVEDMYGDKHDNVVKWDAEQYAQENPLFTDEFGMYQWDVPQGLWQVKFEKEGFQTTYSEWLPVPPPQLEVNIPMTQNVQPIVSQACAYEDGVEIEFDKYMKLDYLTTDQIVITKNGNIVSGNLKIMNLENAYEGQSISYASKVRFEPTVPFLTTDEVKLTVSRKVQSYAGIQMAEDYTQDFDIVKEIKSIVVDSLFTVYYDNAKTMTVSVLPYDAGIGKKLIAHMSSSLISTITSEAILDENGQATLTVTGELPGTTAVYFTIEDANATATTIISVTAQILAPEAPSATRASGTAVYRNTQVALSSDNDKAIIYYTLDGSCPCDAAARSLYYAPITIDEDSMVIKAIAVLNDTIESEIATFEYTLKKTNLGMDMKTGWNWISHNLETSVEPNVVVPSAVNRFMSQTEELVKDPVLGLVGNLKTVSPTSAYKVQMDKDTTYTLSGYELNVGQASITLHKGWNWVGYPINETKTPAEAFSNVTIDHGDYIVGQDGFVQYNSENSTWTGTLETLKPGKGYIYCSASEKAFQYNASTVSKAQYLYGKGLKPTNAPWAVDQHKYPKVMCLVSKVLMEDQEASADYLLGAFCGSECRGIATIVDGKWMMNIFGEGSETITFRVVDNASAEEYGIIETQTFAETMVGDIFNSYPLHIGKNITSLQQERQSKCYVYVNAEKNRLYFNAEFVKADRLTITDAWGAMVSISNEVAANEGVDISHLADGVYIITLTSGNETYYKKIVKGSK